MDSKKADLIVTDSGDLVRVDFYDLQGNADGRFGLEGIVGNKSVWAYRMDTGPNFPKPAPGQTVTAQGWFEVRSTEPVELAAYVMGEKYTAHSRAWAFSLPLYEWPYATYQAKPPGGGFAAAGQNLSYKNVSRKSAEQLSDGGVPEVRCGNNI